MKFCYRLFLLVFVVMIGALRQPVAVMAAPTINNITDNKNSYDGGLIPKYSKFEVTFGIGGSVADNFQLPYDPLTTSIAGLTPGKGISVDGLFLPPGQSNWSNAYRQPGFYYTQYDDQNKGGTPWYYPIGTAWKVRFAPPACPSGQYPCTWQYKLNIQDRGGSTESAVKTFAVTDSTSHGFVKVSSDPRYFQFDDGTYFPGLSINDIGTADKNSLSNTQSFFSKLQASGIQQLRLWLSGWAIFGATWPTYWGTQNLYDGYLPRAGLITNRAESTSTTPGAVLTLVYSEDGGKQNSGSWFDGCRVTGAGDDTLQIPVKNNTKYRIRIRYQAKGISGPRVASRSNYGFVAKINSSNDHCTDGGVGTPITGYAHDTGGWSESGNTWNSSQWAYLEGTWNSGGNSFFPALTLAMENTNNTTPTINGVSYGGHPYAYIDTVEIQEDLGNGQYGLNVVPQGSMSYLEHYNDRTAYAFDKTLDLASQMGVYIRLVLMEKNDQVEAEIGNDGLRSDFSLNNTYGSGRNLYALRWFQQAWWRYAQARWGYSTAIHSWELENEGDNGDSDHYALTDELGKYMHCRAFGISVGTGDGQKCNYDDPNDHPVSTSFWHSLMRDEFWNNSKYPNVDIADIHQYIAKDGTTGTDPSHYEDAAKATYDLSMWAGAKQSSGSNKPIIRGETAFTPSGTDIKGNDQILQDTKGIWLHTFIWGGINPGGLTESYWHYTQHIFNNTKNFGPLFRHYYDFIANIPLANNNYEDAKATTSDGRFRAWGQKDTKNGQASHAHLWVSSSENTWYKLVISGNSPIRLSGTVSVTGFSPNKSYPIEYWDFDRNMVLTKKSATTTADGNGKLTIDLGQRPTGAIDTGIKIGDYSIVGSTPPSVPGDTNGNAHVDIFDYNNLISDFGSSNQRSDFDNSGKVDIFDYNTLISNFGR